MIASGDGESMPVPPYREDIWISPILRRVPRLLTDEEAEALSRTSRTSTSPSSSRCASSSSPRAPGSTFGCPSRCWIPSRPTPGRSASLYSIRGRSAGDGVAGRDEAQWMLNERRMRRAATNSKPDSDSSSSPFCGHPRSSLILTSHRQWIRSVSSGIA